MEGFLQMNPKEEDILKVQETQPSALEMTFEKETQTHPALKTIHTRKPISYIVFIAVMILLIDNVLLHVYPKLLLNNTVKIQIALDTSLVMFTWRGLRNNGIDCNIIFLMILTCASFVYSFTAYLFLFWDYFFSEEENERQAVLADSIDSNSKMIVIAYAIINIIWPLALFVILSKLRLKAGKKKDKEERIETLF